MSDNKQILRGSVGDSSFEGGFSEGGLKRESFLLIGKLFTANVSIIIGVAGRLNSARMSEVLDVLIDILRRGLNDDTS